MLARKALVLCFAFLIATPLVATVLGVDGADPKAEKRDLAEFPAWKADWEAVAGFPAGFTAWFDDHFAFRTSLVGLSSRIHYFVLGVSPNPSVVKGSDGWLYYGGDAGMDDYTRREPFTAAQVAEWRDSIVRTHAWLRARGIAYVFAIAPDKHVIYPEDLPSTIRPRPGPSRLEQLYAALEGTAVPVVDFRPALREAKAMERVYDLTDTHWNRRGAFVAYQQLIEAVRRQSPEVGPARTRADFDAVATEVEGQDLAGMIGLKSVLREVALELRPRTPRRARVVAPEGERPESQVGRLITEVPDSRLPRAVFFRDSFVTRVVPYLSEHFSRAVYLWQNNFDSDEVLNERATVVVQEIVGRHLVNVTPYSDVAR